MYLVNNVFIVANVFLKGNNRLPRVILGVDAGAGDLAVLVSGYSQWVSATNKIMKICLTAPQNANRQMFYNFYN